MFDLEKVKEGRQIKALLWIDKEEFRFISELFEEMDEIVKEEEYKKRKEKNSKARRSSSWGHRKLDSSDKKVFFLLYYLKIYPTYDVLWFTFWMDRSTACVNIHWLLPILKRLLRELWIAPKRKIENIEDLKEAFDWDILDLIADWTERRHFRHKNNKKQKENYSGKKNVIPRRI